MARAGWAPQPRTDLATVERRLPGALASGALAVHFQPVVELVSHRSVGVEALARWHDPVLGQVPPAEFVAAAERTGLIAELGRQVLAAAAGVAAGWHEAPSGLVLNVNVSPVQLRDPGFAAVVAEVVARAGLDPARLCLEVTETAAVEDLAATSRALGDLRTLGIRVALDDFGTGYSSLTVLRELPVDLVKMDRAFVAHLTSDTRGAVLARLIVDAAHAMGMAVCAEGVETREQASQLAALGCDVAQGWLYAPALAADDPRMRQVELAEPLEPLVDAGEYAHAVTGGDDLVFVTDQHGTLEFVSAAAVSLLGLPSAELMGTPLADHLEPHGAPPAEGTDGPRRMVSRRSGPEGRRWLDVDLTTTRDGEGRAWRVVGVGKDVTAIVAAEQRLAQSESRFRRAFDEAPIGMAMSTLDGRFLRVNTAFASMLGRSPAEVLATTVADLTAETDRQVDEQNLREVRAGEAQVHDVVKHYLHRDGSAVPTFVRAALVEGHEGQEPYILAHVLPRGTGGSEGPTRP